MREATYWHTSTSMTVTRMEPAATPATSSTKYSEVHFVLQLQSDAEIL